MKSLVAKGPLCPYHRGKGVRPKLSEISEVGERCPFPSFVSLGLASSFCLGSDPPPPPPALSARNGGRQRRNVSGVGKSTSLGR